MLRASIIAIVLTIVPATAQSVDAPKSLLTRVAEWQYPDSKMSGASMSDAATVNGKGERTVPSVHCKTLLTTTDPIDKVFDYYKSTLTQASEPKNEKETAVATSPTLGRSVTFHSDSDDRPVVLHVISINSGRTSTTLVISRAKGESKTHIAWSQYETYDPNPKQ